MIFKEGLDVAQIIFVDIILSGDNALVIGMAASGLSPELRKKAILYGMGLAAGLRIVFAAVAGLLIQVPGILFVGGLLLVWVCWRFYCEIREHVPELAKHLTDDAGQFDPGRPDDPESFELPRSPIIQPPETPAGN